MDTPVISTVNRSLEKRWGNYPSLFHDGFVGVPISFLTNYSKLVRYGGLSAGEALFVLHLMAYKWGADAPFPSYASLAGRMGVTDKQARRYAQKLEEKGYLKRKARTGMSNSFNLQPLFDDLNDIAKGEIAKKNAQRAALKRAA